LLTFRQPTFSLSALVEISRVVVQIPARSKLTTPGPFSPMAETDGARALLE